MPTSGRVDDVITAVPDTNVIVSALLFGGKPRKIVGMVTERQIRAVTSHTLLSELLDVLAKKFLFPKEKLLLVERKIKNTFHLVYPSVCPEVLRYQADNRVLEASLAGHCQYAITGDKELLKLGSYKTVFIVTPEQFLMIKADIKAKP